MSSSPRAIIVSVFACLAVPAGAQIPVGDEFRVDQGGARPAIEGNETTPRAVAMGPNGRFVVAWTTPSPPDADIAARLFDAAGRPMGPEFLVNAGNTDSDFDPVLASDDAGHFLVVWRRMSPAGGGNMFGQRFDVEGVRLGSEFRVNQGPTSFQRQHSGAMGPGGEFVVTWIDWSVFARRFDAAGVPLGGDVQVNNPANRGSSPSVDLDGAGNFVVVWADVDGPNMVRGQRFSAAGSAQGAQFLVSSPLGTAGRPRVARRRDGAFVVAWQVPVAGGNIVTRRFDASGVAVGGELLVSGSPTSNPNAADVDVDADGDFVVTWQSGQDGNALGVFGRRFDAAGAGGPEFRVNTYTTGHQQLPSLASDQAGNFVVTWFSAQNGAAGAFAQRYAGGLTAAALSVDASPGPVSDGNGVFEAGETVAIAPSWLNANPTAQTFSGTASAFAGPGAPGDPTYSIPDATAAYGTVANGATSSCAAASDCYSMGITVPATRPAPHWDAVFREDIAPAALGAARSWTLHVGESFTDVPRPSAFYRFVEAVLHNRVTAGCSATAYCPGFPTTREQMAVFVLVAREGSGYVPAACVAPMFTDVPASSPFCRWIEELARRGVVSGCGGGEYCPTTAVTREQMAVLVLRTKEPGLTPPACGVPVFADVPPASPFCRWIEELARRGIVTGCGGGHYCPLAAVSREQMAVFLSATFGLVLYGP